MSLVFPTKDLISDAIYKYALHHSNIYAKIREITFLKKKYVSAKKSNSMAKIKIFLKKIEWSGLEGPSGTMYYSKCSRSIKKLLLSFETISEHCI